MGERRASRRGDAAARRGLHHDDRHPDGQRADGGRGERAVRCNASPDVASTTIQLQIYEGGQWRLYGNPSSTASTQPNINISDTAGRKQGCWAYRGVITREAFHHNWGTTTKYSGSASFCG